MTEKEFEQYKKDFDRWNDSGESDCWVLADIARQQTRIADALRPQTITSVFADKLTPDQREILENKVREFKNPEGGDLMEINYTKIWREIGDAYATPCRERTRWKKLITCLGLCLAVVEILKREYLTKSSEWRRKHSYDAICYIGNAMEIGTCWWPSRCSPGFTARIDNERSMFAYFMAELGNEGYEELIKECK